MRPEIKELLLQLPRTSQGQALLVFLQDEMAKIDTVDGASEMKLEQLIAREIAKGLIQKIFDFYEKPIVATNNKPKYN